MRSKTVCFTGHRELPADNLPEISKHLEDTLVTLIEQGYRYFGAGGALGFDTLAAQSVLRLRERYPQIRLILVLPCLNQTRSWQQADVDIYEELKRRADKVTYTSESYFRGCMQSMRPSMPERRLPSNTLPTTSESRRSCATTANGTSSAPIV